MKVIAVCGKKRHGKDTVAEILFDYGYKPIALADPVKRIAADVYQLSYEQLYGDQKETVDLYWGRSPREIFQQIGTGMGRNIHPETWIRYLIRTIYQSPDVQNWVITDVRFPNEAEILKRELGAEIWKVYRPGLPDNDTHTSETSIDAIESDRFILNDGTIEKLRETVIGDIT